MTKEEAIAAINAFEATEEHKADQVTLHLMEDDGGKRWKDRRVERVKLWRNKGKWAEDTREAVRNARSR